VTAYWPTADAGHPRPSTGLRRSLLPFSPCNFTTLILFGSGLSPFKDTGTAFITRLIYVIAGTYTIGMLAVVAPLPRRNR
jgi:hypothetical protein